MKHLILLGPQGSGKGTQSAILCQKYGFVPFDTGKNLRSIAQENSDLGKKVLEITTRGDLVSSEIVMEIVQDFIAKNAGKPIIFDGIPRNKAQKEMLDDLFAQNNMDYRVVCIDVPRDISIKRLLKRAEIEGRADDNLEAIENRLKNYHQHTKPLLEVWQSENKLLTVDGSVSPEDVDEQISAEWDLHE